MYETRLRKMACACGISLAAASLLLAGEGGPPEPVLWLDFAGRADEVCADRSGRGNDARLYGARRVKTPLGPGLKFDGVGDFVALPDIDFHAFKGLTVEAWVRPKGASRQPILGFGVDTVHLKCEGGKAGFTVRNAKSKMSTAGAAKTLARDKFHHVVGTYDKGQVCLYVDGSVEAKVKHSGDIRDDRYIGARLGSALGWPSQTWAYFFRGEMAEVKVYDAALTAEQIKAAYERAGRARKPRQ